VAPTNPRGIPFAPFVDRVEDYVTTRADVEATLKNFQEMISYVSASWSRNAGLFGGQKISVHGSKSATSSSRSKGQDA